MNKTELVSVITPSFNSESYISNAINSVLEQKYQNWEMIIVDDFSSDNSIKTINQFLKKDSRIRLIKLTKNSGAAIARNTAIKSAKGRYIAFLDSDDIWYPEKLEVQINFMEKNNFPFSYSSYSVKEENSSSILFEIIPPMKLRYTDLLKKNSVGCLTAIYDTKHFGKVYMPNIRKRQDLGLWLRLLKKHDFAYGIDITLACYNLRKNSISSNKFDAAIYMWKLYRNHENLNLPKSIYYFIHYALNGIFKNRKSKIK